MCNATQTAVTHPSAASAGTMVAREQEQEKHRRDEPTAAHLPPPQDSDPDRGVREQVERAPAAERECDDGVEFVADVRDDVLHREREEDDPDDHRKVEVGVRVAGEGNAFRPLSVDEDPLAADGEEVEVRKPE